MPGLFFDRLVFTVSGSGVKPATSIEKVCRVLGAFRVRPLMGITELAKKTGLLPSDVHRIVRSLEPFGYLAQDPQSKKYRLGLELLKLGHLVHQRIELREVARPYLVRLSEATEATANLAVFDERELEILFVEQIDSPGEVQIKLRIGARASPHATAVGKVLTAHLPPVVAGRLLKKDGMPRRTPNTITDRATLERELEMIRSRGYATDREEAVTGACCVSAPVRDHRGEVVAAVSVSMMAARMAAWRESQLVSLVRSTAGKISTALGCQREVARQRAQNAG
jgi:DNA-binding IclR family transcriptional regulator